MNLRNCFLIASSLCFSSLLAQGVVEEAIIKKKTEAYAEAYKRHDSKAIAAFWAEDGEYTNPETGMVLQGKAEIEKSFNEFFKNNEKASFEIKTKSIKFPSQDKAVATGTLTIKQQDKAPQETAFKAFFEKKNNEWIIEKIRDFDIAAVPDNYQYLKPLEWLIGDWVDEDEDVEIKSSHYWNESKNFIMGKFSFTAEGDQELNGTTIIGWDPIKKAIHSWMFDSDGTVGEAQWTQKGNIWISETAQILADGRRASAVNIYTPIDANSFKWESTGRAVGGKILPDIEPIIIKKKKG